MEIKLQSLITWTVVLDTMKGDSHLFLRYLPVQQQFQMQDELRQSQMPVFPLQISCLLHQDEKKHTIFI